MTPEAIAREYFAKSDVMQLATLDENGPRVNSVYFVVSDDMKTLYWMSEPQRRHSRALAADARIAGALVAKADDPVAGLQFTGTGSILEDQSELRMAINRYNDKYHNVAKGLYERIKAGTNKHVVYRFAVESLELFDEVYFPGGDVVPVLLD